MTPYIMGRAAMDNKRAGALRCPKEGAAITKLPFGSVRLVPGIIATHDGQYRLALRRCQSAYERGAMTGPLGDDPGPELFSPVQGCRDTALGCANQK